VAGSVLGINPFNQPDVRGCQDQDPGIDRGVRKIWSRCLRKSRWVSTAQGRYLHRRQECRGLAQGRCRWRSRLLAQSPSGAFRARTIMCRCLAYIERDSAHIDALQQMRLEVRDKRHVAPVPIRPAFLHSPGRPTRAAPTAGISADHIGRCQGPRGARTESQLRRDQEAAQARGDFDVLTERGRRALRVHLKGDLKSGCGNARCRHSGGVKLEHDPEKKPAPHLMRGGDRFSDQAMLKKE